MSVNRFVEIFFFESNSEKYYEANYREGKIFELSNRDKKYRIILLESIDLSELGIRSDDDQVYVLEDED